MNTDSLHFALNSLSNIIYNTLNRKNYKQQLADIQKFVNKFGFECERHLYRCIFCSLLSTQYSDINKHLILCQLFTDLGNFFDKPNFVTLVRYSLSKEEQVYSFGTELVEKSNPTTLNKIKELCKCLKLSEIYKLALFFCFDQISDCEKEVQLSKCDFSLNTDLTHHMLIQLHLKKVTKLPFAKEIINKIKQDLESGDSSPTKNHNLLLFSPFVDTKTKMEHFSGLPSLNDEQITNMLVNESGVQLTSELLGQFNVTPQLCARILLSLCDNSRNKENTLQQRTEEIDTLANLCREFLPSASPLTDILQSIDSESFIAVSSKVINSKNFGKISPAFTRFWQFCINLCNTEKQGISILGSIFFTRPWTYNLEFQMGFILNCVKNQLIAKLLSVGPTGPGPGGGNELSTLVANLDSLKCQPDFESNPELCSWKYQRLYQIILDISASNSTGKQSTVTVGPLFYSQIVDLFKWPVTNCADLVALGLLGCNSNSSCKNDILSMTMPAFLSNNPNAAIILHTIWNTSELINNGQGNNQWAKQVLLQAMREYYMKSPIEEQQQRLSRILDVAQDLKALSLLLNFTCYPFVIDLACLASRREYLKLDKWLMDKIESNGEPFISACIVFLNRRCSPLFSSNKSSVDVNSLNLSLPSETLATILACLQQFICNSANNVNSALSPNLAISTELSETILTMVANSSFLLSRRAPPGVINNSSKLKILDPITLKTFNDFEMNSLSLSTNATSFNSQTRAQFTNQSGSQSSLPIPSASIMTSQSQPPVGPAKPAPKVPQSQTSVAPQTGGQDPSFASERARNLPELSNIFSDVSSEIEKEADMYFQKIYNESAAGSMTIDQVLEMLKQFQSSPNQRERDVFQCMIKNLFEEYCYFPRYPDRELLTTAQLFGGIIEKGLVKYMALVHALRYVLDALRKPHGSKMYYFGVAALDKFKTKLKEYPLYCHHLTSIPHFRQFPRPLIEYIECGINSEDPVTALTPNSSSNVSTVVSPSLGQVSQSLPGIIGSSMGSSSNIENNSSRTGVIVPGMINTQGSSMASQGLINNLGGSLSQSSTSKVFFANLINNQVSSSSLNTSNNSMINTNAGNKSTNNSSVISSNSLFTSNSSDRRSGPQIANTTNIDTLLAADVTINTVPPETVQDKVAFIINNLSQMNLTTKAEEFKDIIGVEDTYYGWVAQYFVMKRASIEPNFHTLYANFLDALKNSDLFKLVIAETYRNIKVLLRNDKEIANFSDRSLLRNLGHWLGLLTLAKNKPILSIHLNVKFLIIEAYFKGMHELHYVVPFVARILESCTLSSVFKPPNPWTMGIVKTLIELHKEPKLKLNLRFEVEVLCKQLNVDINEYADSTKNLKDEILIARVLKEQQLAVGPKSQIAQQASQQSLNSNQMPIGISCIGNISGSPGFQNATQIGSTPSLQGSQSLSLLNSLNNSSSVISSHSSQIFKQATGIPSGVGTAHAGPKGLVGNLGSINVQSFVMGSHEHSLLTPANASPAVQIGSSAVGGLQHISGGVNSLPSMSGPSSSTPTAHSFNYHDISTSSIASLSSHMVIQSNLPLLQMDPTLKQWLRPAIERAIQEWIQPVVERSIKISLTTAEQIIKKDFALECDENKMCLAAQHLVRNLTAGMAMITSKEALFLSINSALITAFTRHLGQGTAAPQDLIEATANAIASDNIDLACCFIQKTAIEKAVPELDKRLAPEYEMRRKARLEGRRYCDTSSLTYQAERMPEAIRLKVGSVTPQQFQVYEDIGKNIPGFIAPIPDHPPAALTGLVSSMNPSVPGTGLTTGPGASSTQLNTIGTIGKVGNVALNTGSQQPVPQAFVKSAMSSNVQSSLMIPGGVNVGSHSSASMNVTRQSMMPLSLNNQFSNPSSTEAPSNNVESGIQNLYDKLVPELESLFQQFVQSMQPNVLITTMHSIVENVVACRNDPRDIVITMNLIQRVLEALAELMMSADNRVVELILLTRARDIYLVILKALADERAYGHQWTTKHITRHTLERLLNQSSAPLPDELFDSLMRSDLINISLLDHHLSSLLESAPSTIALAFTLQFIKIYGQHVVHDNQIQGIIAALMKISKASSNPLTIEIQQILESLRTNNSSGLRLGSVVNSGVPDGGQNFLVGNISGMSVSTRELDSDTPEFLEKTERLMRDWISMYHSNNNLEKYFHHFVQMMNQQGILKTDDSITKFFRVSTELCVDFCYRMLNNSTNVESLLPTRTKCFQTLDAFAHLIVMLVEHSGSNTSNVSESSPKLNLLNKLLGIIAGVAIQDQEIRNESFQHLPYYRIFIILFIELTVGPNNLGLNSLQHQIGFGLNPNQLDPFYETIQFQVLSAFCQTLKILKPSKAPSFAFAWLDFVSHRTFMEKFLNGPNGMGSNNCISTKGWSIYAALLIEVIRFEAPFLRNVDLPQSVELLYKGTLKVLLVLLHDFPEFLCEYCYELCDAIPCNAIQMRNLVLSAFPRNMRLPDPFTPNLKIDSLPEISQPPKGTSSSLATLTNVPFRKDLDSYIRTRSPVTFLSELRGYLQQPISSSSDGCRYNIPLMNALVLFVGQAAIQAITPKHISMSSIAHSSHMDIFQNLAVDLDTEGRYLFLNAIANQLRYPNSHTHYFSCTLLYIFAESNTEAIQEQITRVLLERLIVNRPHPWGLLVTFIELIKNPTFKFWTHEFVRCAPEIEKLFESVARSCMQQQQQKSSGNGFTRQGESLVRSQSS